MATTTVIAARHPPTISAPHAGVINLTPARPAWFHRVIYDIIRPGLAQYVHDAIIANANANDG